MKRIFIACAVLVAIVAACTYTTTEFYAVKTKVMAQTNGTCDNTVATSNINRSYDGVPCGQIWTTACNNVPRECEQQGWRYCGNMHWLMLDHYENGQPVCRQGNDGQTCHWSGIDRPSGPDLKDCITKWQTDMFLSTGCYETNTGGIACGGYCRNCGPFPTY